MDVWSSSSQLKSIYRIEEHILHIQMENDMGEKS